jgi:hypothetical protein
MITREKGCKSDCHMTPLPNIEWFTFLLIVNFVFKLIFHVIKSKLETPLNDYFSHLGKTNVKVTEYDIKKSIT